MSLAIGLMSGTSLDGIDVALVDIEGTEQSMRLKLLSFETYDYPDNLLKQIKEVIEEKDLSLQKVSALNFALAYQYVDAVKKLCRANNIVSEQLAFVASHGQTIFHQPFKEGAFQPSTLQLGDASIMANALKTTVVSNFREADMAVGGQGAPIVPYSEYLLYRSDEKDRILQNIGGIGNLTFIPKKAKLDDLIAFDTGPGNMVIDSLVTHFYNESFDRDGMYAARGIVKNDLVDKWLSLPYFSQPYPKSTGRELFGKKFIDEILADNEFQADDLIASATFFTAKSITYHAAQLTSNTTELIIGGGGAHNKTLISMLKTLLPDYFEVRTQEDFGISSDAKEAVAMTVLAQHTLAKLPSNVPSATGADRAVILGRITPYQ